MNINEYELFKKIRDLKVRYKAMQIALKKANIPKHISLKGMEEEKNLYNKFLFYNGIKSTIKRR